MDTALGRRVVVSGATGFIGPSLVARLLADGFSVTVLARSPASASASLTPDPHLNVVAMPMPDSTGRYGDAVRGELDNALHGAFAVLHLAARNDMSSRKTNQDDHAFERDILGLTTELAESARRTGTPRFIYLSSIKARAVPDSGPRPANIAPYAFYKRRTEQMLAQALPAGSTTRSVAIRPPLVYHLDAKGNFRRLVALGRSRFPLPLPRETGRRAMIARANLVDALVTLVRIDDQTYELCAGKVFDVADDQAYTIADIMQGLRTISGNTSPLLRLPTRPIELVARATGLQKLYRIAMSDLVVDSTPFRSATGWRPPHTWPDGLKA